MEFLTADQQTAMEKIASGKNVLITGPAGTGKSFLVKHLQTWAIEKGKTIGITAMTGCAANLVDGQTLHSWSGIGLGDKPAQQLIKKIRFNQKKKLNWQKSNILLIDEVSMLTKELFEKLDTIGQSIRYSSKPFGGIQLVLVGDFCQLPPVVPGREEYPFCFLSEDWKFIINDTVVLKKIIRQNDPVFVQLLNEVRLGQCSEKTKEILNQCLDKERKYTDGIEPTKLYSTRAAVDGINLKKLKALQKPIKSFKLTKSKKIKKGVPRSQGTYLEKKLEKSCNAENLLQLCVGAQVLLLTNLSVEQGLINGSRGVVTEFREEVPYIQFKEGEPIPITSHAWENEEEEIGKVTRNQLPLKLAWAITIHKSQGMSLDCVELELGNRIFEFGQFYTALSRVRTLEALYITKLNTTKIKAHPDVLKFIEGLD